MNATAALLVTVGVSRTVNWNDWRGGGEPVGRGERQVVDAARPGRAGVPASRRCRCPLSVNVTPAGSVPVAVRTAAGKPVVRTMNVPAAPAWNVSLPGRGDGRGPDQREGERLGGGGADAVGGGERQRVGPAGAGRRACRTTVPLAAVNVTPAGSVPVSVKVGAGNPPAVTVNVPADRW